MFYSLSKITREKLANILGISQSPLRKHIEALRKKGFIKRIGRTRGYWKVIKPKDD